MLAFFIVLALIVVIALAYNATSDDKTRRSQTGYRAPDDVPIADTGHTIKVKTPAKSELASFTRKKKNKDSLDLYDKHGDILFAVKGLSYRDEQAQAAAKLCDKGDRLILKREPDNPVDENAVQVYTMTGQMIGYVEREYAETVAELIDYINTCVVYKVTNHELPYIDALVKFSATPFFHASVVITGTFETYPNRNELGKRLQGLGADINTAISGKTTVVVMGNGAGPSKVKKIEDLRAKGHDIRIIYEPELKEILNHGTD